ncbi:hypothetical protein [Cohnella sp.]|uniref:hypothetical protein n=1 Tax=Cohnella sp. TaxID=1883426 RepID=UPI0035672501
MKTFLITVVIIVLLFLISFLYDNFSKSKIIPKESSSSNNEDKGIASLINELDQLGYYKYLELRIKEEVKEESIKVGYLFGWEESGRDYSSDAEDLAEGGVGKLIESVKPYLETQNVKITEIKDDIVDMDYSVVINGISYKIYSEDEMDKDIWELSTNRAFGIINKLLKEVSSNERVYILYGGNDLRAVFLTSEMYKAINESKLIPDREMPIPTPEQF